MSRRVLPVLIDLSVTIHIENSPIAGAVEAINELKTLPDVKLKFVTNTSKESKSFLINRLKKIGFSIEKEEIFTALSAARDLVDREKLRPIFLLENSAMEDFSDVDTSNPNSVLIGLAPSHFHYDRLTEAFNLLLQKDTRIIAVHKQRYFRSGQGLVLGPGCFVRGLEYCTDKEATVVGKPMAEFFLSALRTLDAENLLNDAIMIGDDARDDVGGAQKLGMRGILVKTGKYRELDEEKVENGPWKIAESIVDAVEIVKNLCN